MTSRSFSITTLLFATLLLAVGCTSGRGAQGGGDESSRTYAANYEEAIETVAQVAQDVGLSLESTSALTDSSFVVNAVRVKRVPGASDSVPVVKLKIFVDKLGRENVRIQIDRERMSGSYVRGNSAGNSSMRKDYKGMLFGKLDNRLERSGQSSA